MNSEIRTPAVELPPLLLSSIPFGCGSDVCDTCSLLASQVKWHVRNRQSITERGRSISGEKSRGRKPGDQASRTRCRWPVVQHLARHWLRCLSLQVLSHGACENRHVSLPVTGLLGYWWQRQEKGEKSENFAFSEIPVASLHRREAEINGHFLRVFLSVFFF